MDVLIFASTLGADLLALSHFLDQKEEVRLKILVKDKKVFLNEGIAELYPLDCDLFERRWYHNLVGLRGFQPDITILDKDIPYRSSSKNGMVLWHGFGWKGPNDEEEFTWVHRLLKWCWGETKEKNENFVWQCFGEWDYEHRTKVSGFHEENCKILGAASHDYLINPLDKEKAQCYYDFDIVNRPTVMIAPTWHYGEVFKHWDSDKEIFPKIVDQITNHGANVLLRLHDSFRFDDNYVTFLKELAAEKDQVMLKFKDHHPDNLLDLQIADTLITNYSSIANLFYATGKPTIHIYPVNDADEEFMWRTHHITGTRETAVDSARYIWKLPPEENGGIIANNLTELTDQINLVLKDPKCCEEKARDFLDTYMLGADGKNCERIWQAMKELVYDTSDEILKNDKNLQPA